MHKIIQKFSRPTVRSSVSLILTLIISLLCPALQASGAEDTVVVWHGRNEGGHMLFLRYRRNGAWLKTKQFFSEGPVNSPPVVVVDRQRNFVVWTIREHDSVRLAFRLIDDDKVMQSNFINPPLRYAMAPHMAVDPSGVVWLTFSGSNGDDDIYVSSWSDGEWAQPQQVNADDDLPDVLPIIGVDRTGRVWIRWQGFDGDRYRQYYSRWDGEQWSPEEERRIPETLYESVNARLKTAKMKVNEAPPPESVSYFDTGGEIQVWSSIYKQMYK